MSLAIGILIDDSIVVIENIVRHLRLGQEPREAAITGRAEIGLAALTLTAVDLVVFIPIGTMGGIIGEFFRSFGVSISIAVLMSLFVSFTLTPMLASRWFRKGEVLESDGIGKRGFFAAFDRGYGRFEHNYSRLLNGALRNPWSVFLMGTLLLVAFVAGLTVSGMGFAGPLKLAIRLAMPIAIIGIVAAFWNPVRTLLLRLLSALAEVWKPLRNPVMRLLWRYPSNDVNGRRVSRPALVTTGVALLVTFGVIMSLGLFGHTLGFRFAPGQDQNQVAVTVEAPAGSSLFYTKNITDEVERRIRADHKINPNIKYLLTSVGQSQSGGAGSGSQGTNYANIQVSLYEKAAPLDAVTGTSSRRLFAQAAGGSAPLYDRCRHRAGNPSASSKTFPGALIQANEVNGFGGGGAPLEIDVVGDRFQPVV